MDDVRLGARSALARAGIAAPSAMLTGSFARGDADSTSDVDVHVVHREQWWQKVEVELIGRTWEIVAAPAAYYEAHLRQRLPVLHNILCSAVVLWDEDGVAQALIDAARAFPIARAGDPPEGLGVLQRHRPWALFVDLESFRLAGDEAGFTYTAGALVDLAVMHWTRRELGFLDVKQRFRAVRERHATLYAALCAYSTADNLNDRSAHIRNVLDLAYASTGGVAENGTSDRVPWEVAASYMR